MDLIILTFLLNLAKLHDFIEENVISLLLKWYFQLRTHIRF